MPSLTRPIPENELQRLAAANVSLASVAQCLVIIAKASRSHEIRQALLVEIGRLTSVSSAISASICSAATVG